MMMMMMMNSGKSLSLYSQPFHTNRHGYKMCARVYLSGDSMGKGTHLRLFFVMMVMMMMIVMMVMVVMVVMVMMVVVVVVAAAVVNSGKTLSLYSQPFHINRHGYKMCARVYLKSDGMGKGHTS